MMKLWKRNVTVTQRVFLRRNIIGIILYPYHLKPLCDCISIGQFGMGLILIYKIKERRILLQCRLRMAWWLWNIHLVGFWCTSESVLSLNRFLFLHLLVQFSLLVMVDQLINMSNLWFNNLLFLLLNITGKTSLKIHAHLRLFLTGFPCCLCIKTWFNLTIVTAELPNKRLRPAS